MTTWRENAAAASIAWFALILLVLAAARPAVAVESLVVTIHISDQMMQVEAGGRLLHEWPVSTARPGYRTPLGTFRPLRLERMWYSTIYDNAPMPYSVFFHRGYAIHGTTEIARLGTPASHGCVRLHPDNARRLFELILAHGMAATAIVVHQ